MALILFDCLHGVVSWYPRDAAVAKVNSPQRVSLMYAGNLPHVSTQRDVCLHFQTCRRQFGTCSKQCGTPHQLALIRVPSFNPDCHLLFIEAPQVLRLHTDLPPSGLPPSDLPPSFAPASSCSLHFIPFQLPSAQPWYSHSLSDSSCGAVQSTRTASSVAKNTQSQTPRRTLTRLNMRTSKLSPLKAP